MKSSDSQENENGLKREEPNLKGDRLHIVLLIYLYILQFIPRGLITAIPLILQNRKATYEDQARFSFVTYSFGLKILWAPVVDCVYSKTIGRRKTWLLPTQYLLAALFFFISMNVDEWLGSENGTRQPSLRPLIIAFFVSIFLTATQDVAVDGWSLTMLQKKNVGYSSTCNHIGSAIGNFLGFVPFIVLDSKDFANMFRTVPEDRGFITFSHFMYFWFVVFTISTTAIWIFKRDNSSDAIIDESECRLGFGESYRRLWQISKCRPVKKTCLVLFTSYMAFGAVTGIARLKLMDAGVPRDHFALMTIPSLPFVLVLPFLFSRHLSGNRSIRTFLDIYIFKLILGIVYAVFIYFTPLAKDENQTFPIWYYLLLVFIYNLDHIADFMKILAVGAFVCRNSDSRFGGIYITLFSTVLHVGSVWPVSVCLWLVDSLTVKSCMKMETCCKVLSNGPQCEEWFHGFFTETILCTLIGFMWFYWAKKQIQQVENMDLSLWLVKQKPSTVKDKPLLITHNDTIL